MVLFILGLKLESIPFAILTQGVVKEDWVSVWFVSMKVNITESPTAAWIVFGE